MHKERGKSRKITSEEKKEKRKKAKQHSIVLICLMFRVDAKWSNRRLQKQIRIWVLSVVAGMDPRLWALPCPVHTGSHTAWPGDQPGPALWHPPLCPPTPQKRLWSAARAARRCARPPGSQWPHNQVLSLSWAEDTVMKFRRSNLRTSTISSSSEIMKISKIEKWPRDPIINNSPCWW